MQFVAMTSVPVVLSVPVSAPVVVAVVAALFGSFHDVLKCRPHVVAQADEQGGCEYSGGHQKQPSRTVSADVAFGKHGGGTQVGGGTVVGRS